MLHLIKYRFIQTIRKKDIMFWSLMFPIVMATFFYFSFGKNAFEDLFQKIPVALVETKDSQESLSFTAFLEEMDGDLLKVEKMSEAEALKALSEGGIKGIYYDTKTLSVSESGTTSSILETLLHSYLKNEAMMTDIMKHHPEKMEEAAAALGNFQSMTENVSTGGRTLDTGLSYFFALIGMACMYGTFQGVQCMQETRANVSALGARQCITPTHKMTRILVNSFVTYVIQFLNVVIGLCYIKYILKMDLGGNMGGMLLVCLLGSIIGVSIGIMIGCTGFGEGIKTGLSIAVSMISAFAGGMMTPDTKTMLEMKAPLVNRLNPTALISDAFYCLNIYDDRAKYTQCLLILAAMSVVFIGIGFLMVRRERYDSI